MGAAAKWRERSKGFSQLLLLLCKTHWKYVCADIKARWNTYSNNRSMLAVLHIHHITFNSRNFTVSYIYSYIRRYIWPCKYNVTINSNETVISTMLTEYCLAKLASGYLRAFSSCGPLLSFLRIMPESWINGTCDGTFEDQDYFLFWNNISRKVFDERMKKLVRVVGSGMSKLLVSVHPVLFIVVNVAF